MPQPTPSDVHVDRALTDVSVSFFQNEDDYAFNQVFPGVDVPESSNDYYIWDKDALRRTEAAKRGPGSEAAERGQELKTQKYSTDVWAVKQPIDDQTRGNQDAAVQLEEGVTMGLMQDLMLRLENEFASNYMTSGTWNQELDGSSADFTQWDDSSSTPIENITDEVVRMKRVTGFRPNVLVLGMEVFNALRNNDQLIERLKYTDDGPVTTDMMESLFQIDNIVVAQASQNVADEGATASNEFVVGKSALLAHAAPNPALMTPSAGYRFQWSDLSGGENGIRTLNYRDENRHSDIIEVESAFDMHVVGEDLGTLFYNAIT